MPTAPAARRPSIRVGLTSFLFEGSVGFALRGEYVGMMGKSIQECSRELLVGEHGNPFAECEIGGHHSGAPFIAVTDEVEQQLSSGSVKGYWPRADNDGIPSARDAVQR